MGLVAVLDILRFLATPTTNEQFPGPLPRIVKSHALVDSKRKSGRWLASSKPPDMRSLVSAPEDVVDKDLGPCSQWSRMRRETLSTVVNHSSVPDCHGPLHSISTSALLEVKGIPFFTRTLTNLSTRNYTTRT